MTMPCHFCKWIFFLLWLRLASRLVATLKITKFPKNSPAHQKKSKIFPHKTKFFQKNKISQKIPKIPKNTKLTPKNPKNLPKPPQNITQITIFPQNLPKNFRPTSPKFPKNSSKTKKYRSSKNYTSLYMQKFSLYGLKNLWIFRLFTKDSK